MGQIAEISHSYFAQYFCCCFKIIELFLFKWYFFGHCYQKLFFSWALLFGSKVFLESKLCDISLICDYFQHINAVSSKLTSYIFFFHIFSLLLRSIDLLKNSFIARYFAEMLNKIIMYRIKIKKNTKNSPSGVSYIKRSAVMT